MVRTFVKVIATFFGVGFIPIVPATWASAVAVVLAWFLSGGLFYWFVAFSVAGLWACRPAVDVFQSKDPKPFVMDEVCGMMVSVLWLPKNVTVFLAAFFLFRVLDVWKPWPISRIQESKHPWSIMWDDLAAGLLANLILRIIAGI
ncbi:MAG: hypothetical protein A3C47_01000 [Omnitrophica bacterium RIFCSPHIGHO2_02_FULL_51_18]|nr:MAG: hypothetical protein A3C47_01000 [Omnitrophica bacterium RIFCSPHIGHO2_02_FULL_51_18]